MVPWDLQRLRILRELAERRTLTAVADALGYSPSAMSQQMAVLEKEAGTALMQGAGRGVRLTDAGRLLAHHAGRLLSAAEAARVDLAALSGDVRGTVRAGGLQSVLRHLLIPTLADLLLEEPLVVVLPVDHPRSQDRRPVSITSLSDEVWVASASGTGHRSPVTGHRRHHRTQPAPAHPRPTHTRRARPGPGLDPDPSTRPRQKLPRNRNHRND